MCSSDSGFVGPQQHVRSRTSTKDWRHQKGWKSSSWWDLQLSLGIVAQTSAKAVLQFCSTRLPQLHLVNLSTALHRVAKSSDRLQVLDCPELQGLVRCLATQLNETNEASPLTLASVCWACAKLSYLDMSLFDMMATQAIGCVQRQGMGFQQCSNIAWAYAILELFHGPLLEALGSLTVDTLSSFDSQAVSNLVWAFAKLLVLDEPLMSSSALHFVERLSESSPQNRSNFCWAFAVLLVRSPLVVMVHQLDEGEGLHELDLQDLTNTAWALACLECLDAPLLHDFAAEFLLKVDSILQDGFLTTARLQDTAFAIVSVSWVFAFTSILSPGLCGELAWKLSKIGLQVDSCADGIPNVRQSAYPAAQGEGRSGGSPRIVFSTRGMAVVFKPPGWEVDGPQSEPSKQGLLSDFLRAEYPSHSLPFLSDFQYGFIHRLDVPSSGLILAGTTFQGLYSLRMQINTFSMFREYLVLCHGIAPASLTECCWPIDMVSRRSLAQQRPTRSRSSGSCDGRAALTWFRFLAHGHGMSEEMLSVVCVRIHTGRNHQIRTHLQSTGYPTVVDGRYTCCSVHLQESRSLQIRQSQQLVLSSTVWDPRGQAASGLQRLRSTSGLELRAFPGEVQDGRRPHVWSWQSHTSEGKIAVLDGRLRCHLPEKHHLESDCGKLRKLAIMLKEFKARNDKCIIFTQFSKMLDVLETFVCHHSFTYVRMDSAVKVDRRQDLVDRFNDDERIFLFICSTRAGGVGINLMSANTVIFYDSDWNPAMDRQATDRAHRIGQTREVHIYRLVSEHTIEENIWRRQLQKRELDDMVVDQGRFTTEELEHLHTGATPAPAKPEEVGLPVLAAKSIAWSAAEVRAMLQDGQDPEPDREGPRASDAEPRSNGHVAKTACRGMAPGSASEQPTSISEFEKVLQKVEDTEDAQMAASASLELQQTECLLKGDFQARQAPPEKPEKLDWLSLPRLVRWGVHRIRVLEVEEVLARQRPRTRKRRAAVTAV
ncbi:SRCAP [Symbiodinium necroappetens]|uniref:SRCAP protein n=1 Tax=Symbiodinium necroappetens TaxID=1628268 RepID=A0A812PNY5_9DINO|nr:SRCAP [Symbiodinium necroappetens]